MSSRLGRGVVYLVGAGPGDPALITRRGAELLARADVVVYDRLVDPGLLELAPRARHVYAGKPGVSQEEINQLLVREASAGRTVVRLKGGDPFVLGRGGEECRALAAAGIRFEVVPGVTSAVAAPASAGIPLTHRGVASWVVIATGQEDPGGGRGGVDWAAVARAPTAVILMGTSRLGEITSALLSAGRAAETPAAVVARATWPDQRVVRSSLGRIAAETEAAGLEAPAVLVVGEVVALAEHLDWSTRRPLAGRRVFVPRARSQAGELVALLREAGAVPLACPAIRIEPPTDPRPLSEALGRLSSYAWVVFTSANGVDAVFSRLRDARAFGGVSVAAIGPATASRLAARGIEADLVPASFRSAALGDAFPAGGGKVLVPRAEEAPDDLPKALSAKGWRVEVVPAYRTVADRSSLEEGRAALAEGVDAVLFTSGSTVRCFLKLWGPPPPGALVCCIGPQTAEAASAAGLRVDVVAREHTAAGLVAALAEAVGG